MIFHVAYSRLRTEAHKPRKQILYSLSSRYWSSRSPDGVFRSTSGMFGLGFPRCCFDIILHKNLLFRCNNLSVDPLLTSILLFLELSSSTLLSVWYANHLWCTLRVVYVLLHATFLQSEAILLSIYIGFCYPISVLTSVSSSGWKVVKQSPRCHPRWGKCCLRWRKLWGRCSRIKILWAMAMSSWYGLVEGQ